mgnify:FL=1
MTHILEEKSITGFKFCFLFALLLLLMQFFVFGNSQVLAEDITDSDGVKVFQSDEGNSIIPKPGSGTPPSSATDRGGALQLTLLGLLVLFPIIAIVSVRRQSRKFRHEETQ